MTLSMLVCLLMADDMPTAVIAGPQRAARGDLIVLDASASKASDFAWALVNSTKPCLAIEGGRKCVFASGEAGEFVFVLAVASKDRVALARHTVAIGDAPGPPAPTPHPQPQPGPPPAPDLPIGRFDLSRFGWSAALRTVEASPEARAEQALQLAESFRTTAAAIVAGGLVDPQAILEQTRTSNNAALRSNAPLWKPWAAELAGKLEALEASGKLVGATDFAAAWLELAVGLEAVRARLP